MKRLSTLLTIVLVLSFGLMALKPSEHATSTSAVSARLRPSPEMQKLFDAFQGKWAVSESFEISASQQGKTRQGVASFHAGPGFSLIEDYKSSGSAGPLNFLALLWWDQSAQAYRLFTCANNDGCAVRGTAKWDGNSLVNSWQEEINGKPATFKDSFVDISPSAFRLVSEGSSDGKTIWRVITKYTRLDGKQK